MIVMIFLTKNNFLNGPGISDSLPGFYLSGMFNHKTFNADHVRLTSSKHTRSLATEGEFL